MNITACIITDGKDLTALKRCILSVGKSCNEIIIGANNNSYEFVKKFNGGKIKVIEQVWENNFSKARNEIIKIASGDWILTIDTDEILMQEIKYLDEKFEFYFVSQENSGYPYWNIRIFKNHKGYFYKNKVHESLEYYVTNDNAAKSNVTLKHNGYELSDEDILKKLKRNYKIMLTDFGNPVRNYHLGNYEYLANKNYKKAIEYYEKSLKDNLNAEHKSSSLNNLYLCKCFLNYPEEELKATLENSLMIFPKQKQARVYAIELLIKKINETNKGVFIPVILKELTKIEKIQKEKISELYSDINLSQNYFNNKRKEIVKWQ